MVPLTDNIVFGRKIAFLCAMEAAVGSSFPRTRRKLSTFSTSGSSESTRQRRGTVKVTPRLRSPRPSLSGQCGGALLPHRLGHPKMPKRLKERRIPPAHRCTRSVNACEQPRAQCQLACGARTCEAGSRSWFPPPRY